VNGLSGWIVCLDADCTVSENYLSQLLHCQKNDPRAQAGSIHFEHPIPESGSASAIYQYELHLRYFIEMQRRLHLPYAYHTVGSAMFVRALEYALKGGMNTRRAGEDFYFLHKFTLEKGFRQLRQPVVYPSGRMSSRVPFGTGRAVADFKGTYLTYNTRSFKDIAVFLNQVDRLAGLPAIKVHDVFEVAIPQSIQLYLEKSQFISQWYEMKKHTASTSSFMKRFYQWFNAFRLMKCLHFLRDNHHDSEPVLALAEKVLPEELKTQQKDLLELYRQMNLADQWRAG
jgi:hypothetical protein